MAGVHYRYHSNTDEDEAGEISLARRSVARRVCLRLIEVAAS